MSDAPEIPKTCFAGVTVNEGPDFHLEVQEVPVPEPGQLHYARYLFGMTDNGGIPKALVNS
jgi:hypothetical protein